MIEQIFNEQEVDVGRAYVVGVYVKPTEHSKVLIELKGAYVDCFAMAASYDEAVGKALEQLKADGLQPVEVIEPIVEIGISDWTAYAESRWPNRNGAKVTQSEFESTVLAGGVVYGPFSAYDPLKL